MVCLRQIVRSHRDGLMYSTCGMRWLPCSLHVLLCVRSRSCRRARNRLSVWISELWSYVRLLLCSLCFNSLTDSDVVFDSVFEPVFFTVDYVTRWFGMAFVCLVLILVSSILVIAYIILLPLILNTYSPFWIVWHLCYGHWIIVMIAFHYYKAAKTSPGFPPTIKSDIPFVSVCKRCIVPKPARTHHCGICNRCILKMDHHCPWLNNCVGHFNHRYFFSFCLFLTLGCIYCSISGRQLFLDAYNALEPSSQTPLPPYTFKDRMINKSIIYMWVLTSTVAVALGGLTMWHAVLISRGETSIERHINRKEKARMAKWGKVYRNPFSYGRLNNWKMFLGVEKRSHWVTRVLLPSGHAPCGDGLTWDVFLVKTDMIPV
ncbi:palmitoyltransferase ZDHHC16A isoform X2 [Thalassophryne amazonica]|uniref:palmitoyltransferase ZDHHC16A isoform X2 n=1 Tax=Thalassophryne amazonica TaxID=390379 RepID=UPI0014708A74|nr:palmitoyltransferase ZDHHC16A isoform X2 [Thalassophryne amazonica]